MSQVNEEKFDFGFLPVSKKCRILIFFNDEKSWEKYKDKFSSSLTVRQTQWEGGRYIIVTGLEKSQVDLNLFKDDSNVYKILFQVEK